MPETSPNDVCKKCGKKDNLTDIKIKNQDLGKLCSSCHAQFQDEAIKTFKTFVEKE